MRKRRVDKSRYERNAGTVASAVRIVERLHANQVDRYDTTKACRETTSLPNQTLSVCAGELLRTEHGS